jgi:hypothetical protein
MLRLGILGPPNQLRTDAEPPRHLGRLGLEQLARVRRRCFEEGLGFPLLNGRAARSYGKMPSPDHRSLRRVFDPAPEPGLNGGRAPGVLFKGRHRPGVHERAGQCRAQRLLCRGRCESLLQTRVRLCSLP